MNKKQEFQVVNEIVDRITRVPISQVCIHEYDSYEESVTYMWSIISRHIKYFNTNLTITMNKYGRIQRMSLQDSVHKKRVTDHVLTLLTRTVK